MMWISKISTSHDGGLVKICPRCLNEKHLSNFSKARSARDGLKSHCKECVRKSRKPLTTAQKERSVIASTAYKARHPMNEDQRSRLNEQRRRKYRENKKKRIEKDNQEALGA